MARTPPQALNDGERFICLWPKSMQSQVFKSDGLWRVWTWCLMKASHEGHWFPVAVGKGQQEVRLEPGQFIFGRISASKELGMPPRTIHKRMQKLSNIGNLTLKSDTHYTIVTICHWSLYQFTPGEKGQGGGQQRDSQGTAGGHIQYSREGIENPTAAAAEQSDLPEIGGLELPRRDPDMTPEKGRAITSFTLAFRKVFPNRFKNAHLPENWQRWANGQSVEFLLSVTDADIREALAWCKAKKMELWPTQFETWWEQVKTKRVQARPVKAEPPAKDSQWRALPESHRQAWMDRARGELPEGTAGAVVAGRAIELWWAKRGKP